MKTNQIRIFTDDLVLFKRAEKIYIDAHPERKGFKITQPEIVRSLLNYYLE